jgi:hypothetical protein
MDAAEIAMTLATQNARTPGDSACPRRGTVERGTALPTEVWP